MRSFGLTLVIGTCVLLSACDKLTTWGKNNVPNYVERVQWTVPGEYNKDPEALYRLGESYCCGTDAFHSNRLALRYWCMAAREGQRDAMFEVGRVYEQREERYTMIGSAIKKDWPKARAMYSMAVKNGHDEAAGYKKLMEKKMTFDQLQMAEKYEKDWPNVACGMSDNPWKDPDKDVDIDVKRKEAEPLIR